MVLTLCEERGIRTEDVECNLRGETRTLILFVIPVKFVCKLMILSEGERYTLRLLILAGISVQQKVLQNKGRYN